MYLKFVVAVGSKFVAAVRVQVSESKFVAAVRFVVAVRVQVSEIALELVSQSDCPPGIGSTIHLARHKSCQPHMCPNLRSPGHRTDPTTESLLS
jgi:hypothetical protein